MTDKYDYWEARRMEDAGRAAGNAAGSIITAELKRESESAYGVKVKIEKIHPDAKIPTRGTPLRAYYDVYSVEDVTLTPEKVFMVHTGLKVQPPKGFFIDIRPRSGLAKEGVTVNNSPGTLDCDYGGELIIELIWHVDAHFGVNLIDENTGTAHHAHTSLRKPISKGNRIAQINVMPMYEIVWIPANVNGTEGFGSTGR